MNATNFWDLNIGQIISAVGIIIAIWKCYSRILEKVETSTAAKERLLAKVDEIYTWFKENSEDLINTKAKVDLLYQFWFDAQREKKG